MTEMHDRQDAASTPDYPDMTDQAESAEFARFLPARLTDNRRDPVTPRMAAEATRPDAVALALTRQLAAGISATLALGREPGSTARPCAGDAGARLDKPSSDLVASEQGDDLEIGIASVFAELHAAGIGPDRLADHEDGADHPGDNEDAPVDPNDAATLRLLGELDRLWHQRAA